MTRVDLMRVIVDNARRMAINLTIFTVDLARSLQLPWEATDGV